CIHLYSRDRCIITIYNSPSCLIVLSATFKSAALSALGMAVAKTFWSFSTVSYSSLNEPSRSNSMSWIESGSSSSSATPWILTRAAFMASSMAMSAFIRPCAARPARRVRGRGRRAMSYFAVTRFFFMVFEARRTARGL
ncbi:unnamed protein product, partial [Pelagomonas calceolata]